MKKNILLLSCILLMSSVAYAENNIAVVDLQQIVSNSSEVKQLKREHSKKIEELKKIVANARGEISNETDPAKILLLEEKYTKEFNTNKEMLEKEYNTKISNIEKNIKNEIVKKAQKDNYEYVFAKSVVLFGGKDITSEILSSIK